MYEKVYPMTRTAPSGSFRILGERKLFTRSMSGAFSSSIHFARLLQTKMISFVHQDTSVRYVSNEGFPRSRLHASMIAGSLSLRPQYSFLNCFRRNSSGRVLCARNDFLIPPQISGIAPSWLQDSVRSTFVYRKAAYHSVLKFRKLDHF
jgi:hypothetical protein